MDVSIVIPLFNEEESLPELTTQIMAILTKLNQTYEICFIDDGSTDNSLQILKELRSQYHKPYRRVITLCIHIYIQTYNHTHTLPHWCNIVCVY